LFAGKTGTNILQKAMVPILRDDECLKWHEQKNIHLELYSEMFCAGHRDGHMDACLVSTKLNDHNCRRISMSIGSFLDFAIFIWIFRLLNVERLSIVPP